MPDIRYMIQLQAEKGNFSQSFVVNNRTTDMATAGMLSVTLSLGTTTTEISTATMGSLGICFARSLGTSTAQTVSFGRISGTTLFDAVRLKGGDAAMLRLAPGNYAAKASAAGEKLLLNILED